jgi:signal transduction histidine kinase
MGEVIVGGSPILRTQVPADCVYPHEFHVAESLHARSFMFVPLKSRGRVFGTLNFASIGEPYGEDHLRLAQEIADHLGIVIEHTFLHEDSKQMGRLEERNRLAREIHDTLAQSLTGILIQLDVAAADLGEGQNSVLGSIEAARSQARDSLESARRSVWDLRPTALDAGNLADALRGEVDRAREGGLRVSLRVEGDPPADIDGHADLALLASPTTRCIMLRSTRGRRAPRSISAMSGRTSS